MLPLDAISLEIESVERHLSRRGFLKFAALVVVIPREGISLDDRQFIRRMAATLIPAEALGRTGIDVAENVEHLLARGDAEHRAKVLRLLSWARRISFLYGGEQIALRTRTSRFVLMQKMSKALSALCLIAFWGDERTLRLIGGPEVAP
jgi:hypothetical protein